MAVLPDNVEKSLYFPNDYIIYDAARRVWYARKGAQMWTATPGANNKAREIGKSFDAPTLTALAHAVGGYPSQVQHRTMTP